MRLLITLLLSLSHSLYAQDILSIRDMIDGPLKNYHQISIISKLNDIKFNDLTLSGKASNSFDYGYQWYNFFGGLNRKDPDDEYSPAQKLTKLTNKEYTIKKSLHFWEGLCNGVANLHSVANLPIKDVKITNKNTSITLSPKDIHAIASFAMNERVKNQPLFGKRCNTGILKQKSYCHAVNPAIFHILLANQLGIKKVPIVIDAQRYKKVNNLPVYEFSTEVMSISNSIYRNEDILVYRLLTYIAIPKYVSFKNGTSRDKTKKIKYEYKLYINSEDKIIGGNWISNKRPDFIWLPTCERFKGEFEFLNNVLDWKC